MFLCPCDLERCDREQCAAGRCEMSGERILAPCVACGALIVLKGHGICADCITVEVEQAQES